MKLKLFCNIKLFSLGLISILENSDEKYNIELIKELSALKDIKENTIAIVVLENKDEQLLKHIEDISKNNFVNLLIIDLIGSKKNIEKLVKLNIMGYLVSTASLEDINFALEKIKNGAKYYHSSVTEILLSTKTPSLNNLSKREEEILKEISKGHSNLEISYNLNISENTVKKHISNIFQKINCKDRVQAALYAKEIIEN